MNLFMQCMCSYLKQRLFVIPSATSIGYMHADQSVRCKFDVVYAVLSLINRSQPHTEHYHNCNRQWLRCTTTCVPHVTPVTPVTCDWLPLSLTSKVRSNIDYWNMLEINQQFIDIFCQL